MIRTFASQETERVFLGYSVKELPSDIQRTAQRKLRQIHSAEELKDLVAPPGSRLKLLEGDKAGLHSIRINDRWRIFFIWKDGGAEQVKIVDYH
jgi:proteic killer suppression protein